MCFRLLLKRLQKVIDQDFLSGKRLSKTFRPSNITKIPFAFKPEPSLNLSPMLNFKLRFPISIITSYEAKANACSPWNSCFELKTLSLILANSFDAQGLGYLILANIQSDFFLSLMTILKDLSRILFIRLFDFLQRNIQIKSQ